MENPFKMPSFWIDSSILVMNSCMIPPDTTGNFRHAFYTGGNTLFVRSYYAGYIPCSLSLSGSTIKTISVLHYSVKLYAKLPAPMILI